MPACTFISKTSLVIFILLNFIHFAPESRAQGAAIPPNAIPGAPGDPMTPAVPAARREDPKLFDQSSPYLDYGDFNMNEEENDDALYFQYGRFFGVSLGAGYQAATGNRGKLYEAALPRVDIRMHYWFNFNFAMDLGVWFANHQFSYGGANTKVNLVGYGIHLKYYFDVKDASAALTFANPFIEFGAGAISKSESTLASSLPDITSTLSMDIGGGLEFPITHKKTYFIVEGLYHTQSFPDSIDDQFILRVPNLSGGFITVMGHFMFVW